MGRVIACANQKGGVAKTTTVHTLGAALAERGRDVLLVDLDPQACLTYSLGIDSDGLAETIHDVLVGRVKAPEVLLDCEPLHLLPSCIDLAGAELFLLSRTGREYVLRSALQPLIDFYDYVLIDCPPSLGILTVNGLTAAGDVLIPLQPETLSRRGVGQLLDTIEDVRAYTNRDLRVLGAVATMFDRRTRLGREVVEGVEQDFGIALLAEPIPKTVRVAEAPGLGRSVLEHARRSSAADAYRALAAAVEAAP